MDMKVVIGLLLISKPLSSYNGNSSMESERQQTRRYVTSETETTPSATLPEKHQIYTTAYNTNSSDTLLAIEAHSHTDADNDSKSDISPTHVYQTETWEEPTSWYYYEENDLYYNVFEWLISTCLPVIVGWGIISNVLVIVTLVERNISPQHLSLIFLAGENRPFVRFKVKQKNSI